MELGGQIKKHRDGLGLSQEELAEKIFVTRQSVSNWENGKTYPDIHTLLLLSGLFGCSLDELIKGDVEQMKKEISKAEIERLNRWGGVLGLLMLALVLMPVPLLKWFDFPIFLLVMIPLFVVTMGVALRVEKIKKDNDVQTYKEIVAFSEGKTLDELEKAKESGKRPYQKILAAVLAAGITLVVAILMTWLLK